MHSHSHTYLFMYLFIYLYYHTTEEIAYCEFEAPRSRPQWLLKTGHTWGIPGSCNWDLIINIRGVKTPVKTFSSSLTLRACYHLRKLYHT